MKRGFFFSIDAFLAATLLIAAVLIITQHVNPGTPQQESVRLSQDTLQTLSAMKIKEVQDPWVQDRITNGTIDDPELSVIVQLGKFWALNQTIDAQTLTTIILTNILPPGFDLSVRMEDDVLYNLTSANSLQVASTRRMISGISKGEALDGNSGVAFLQHITSKRTSTYTYFGGFVGQGNISTTIELPVDINDSQITEIWFEADIDQEFTIFFNGMQCGGTNNVTAIGNFTPDAWNFTSCKSDLSNGTNTLRLTFADVNSAFIGGGFFRVTYITDEFQQAATPGQVSKSLPGIEGIVNLYDSFDVNGELAGLDVRLHYFANHSGAQNNSFYLTIGNDTVFVDTNSTTEQDITLTNATLANLINYTLLNRTTVPIRVGFQNLSFATDYVGAADVMIVTDVSGSMAWEMVSSSTGVQRNCADQNLGATDTERLSVAKCLDKTFANDIMSITGNLVGLVSYAWTTNTGDTVPVTTNLSLINVTVGNGTPQTGYSASGATCICCGINSASNELMTQVKRTELIALGSSWSYNDSYLLGAPPVDVNNNSWYNQTYALESTWATGPAILGATNSYVYSPTVTTELAYDFGGGITLYADLWEHVSDTPGAPNDFSGGVINQTANTFGLGSGDDGWDWDAQDGTGVYGYDDDFDYAPIGGGQLEMDNQQSGENRCSNYDCSGAFGIVVNITDALYAQIVAGGSASLQFDYDWLAAGGSNPFKNSDEVWIKASWESPTTGVHYLGNELSNAGGDSTFEVDNQDNPDTDFTGTHTQDIASWIEGAGLYYFTLGGKLYAGKKDRWGRFRFDNIQLSVSPATTNVFTLDLWEHTSDTAGAPNDFSSEILNQTANTYGLGAGDDGWDTDSQNGVGVFGYDDDIDYTPFYLGQLDLGALQGGSNQCSSYDCSGAYGLAVTVSPAEYAVIQNNGTALLSFDYIWDDVWGNYFEADDEVWVKARWTSPTSGAHYLGSEKDLGHDGADSDNEIAASDNPDADIVSSFNQDIAQWIEGAGTYYLELGGKLLADSQSELGWWSFDNLQISVSNMTNTYYFRKHFTVNAADYGRGVLNVLVDDTADVYINGNKIELPIPALPADYWDISGVGITSSNFVVGDNVIAIATHNPQAAAKFDLQLSILNTTREHAMMMMSDGVTNQQCGQQSTGSPTQDAIQAACDAHEDYGISVYAVGFSDQADDATLAAIAKCGSGLFKKSSNTTELQEFYTDVAFNIISASIQSQTVVVQGAFENSILYNDSYINFTYDPIVTAPSQGEIELVFQTDQFNTCNASVEIFDDLRLADAVVTSYSGEHWTNLVSANGIAAFNLSDFSANYIGLGDPYRISIPIDLLQSGANNSIMMSTGDSPTNMTGCSMNNSLIYTAYVNSTTIRSSVLEFAEGCNWDIEFEDLSTITVPIPQEYNGTSNCSYTSTNISYKVDDAYDDVVHRLFDTLDFDNDGRLFINLDESDLEVIVTIVTEIPYLWGPTIAQVVVSR